MAFMLIEAETFDNLGGWVIDTQCAEAMGSPYIMAHGLGHPVADATTTSYNANPRYSVTEVGLGLQAILVGAEVGVDPAEVFDLAFGFLFIDFREDDL